MLSPQSQARLPGPGQSRKPDAAGFSVRLQTRLRPGEASAESGRGLDTTPRLRAPGAGGTGQGASGTREREP